MSGSWVLWGVELLCRLSPAVPVLKLQCCQSCCVWPGCMILTCLALRTILLGSEQRSVAACMPHGSAHFGLGTAAVVSM